MNCKQGIMDFALGLMGMHDVDSTVHNLYRCWIGVGKQGDQSATPNEVGIRIYKGQGGLQRGNQKH